MKEIESFGKAMATDADNSRYRGHISLCEIDYPGQEALREAKVAVIGCGGLGSPLCYYLGAAGVGTMTLVDADRVSVSNLQRQIIHFTADLGREKVLSAAEKINALNPDVKVRPVCSMLTDENASAVLEGCDVVADCTDSFRSRLSVSGICKRMNIPCVTATVSRFSGQLFTWLPGKPSFAEIFGEEDPGTASTSGKACSIDGVFNAAVGVLGSLQAAEVLKLITGAGDTLDGRLLTFDALAMDFHIFDL